MDINGVGRLIEWGEWWRLIYYGCGHETRFVRTAHSPTFLAFRSQAPPAFS